MSQNKECDHCGEWISKYDDDHACYKPKVWPFPTSVNHPDEPAMKELRFNMWLNEITYAGYYFELTTSHGRTYLQGNYYEPDIKTGNDELQYTRKWLISDKMTKSEFIQTVFKCALTSAEHRCREHFRYKGSAVYSPHYDVDALEQLCKQKKFDYRTE